MTIANDFLRELALIERDRRGYADGVLLCGFMERVRRAAVDEAWPFGVDVRISPDEPEEQPARRISFLFSKDEVEEVPTRPSEVMKAEILRRIESLRDSLQRIERSLDEDEPDEVDVRWGFAKAIIIENLDRSIRSYFAEAKRKEKE